MKTRLERVLSLKLSVDRMARLAKLEPQVPMLIFESERRLACKRLCMIPTTEKEINEKEEFDADIEKDEQAHLHATGYYKDIPDA